MARLSITAGVAVCALAVSLYWFPELYEAPGMQASVHEGPATAVGDGEARAFVELDPRGRPARLGVRLSAAALEGLPEEPRAHGPAWEYHLALPPEAEGSGYDHVTVDWNPHGHTPPGIYDRAHFDFHFYLIDAAARDRITLTGDGAERASMAPPPEFMPPGYVLPEDTAEPRMGAHAINPAAPEFGDGEFTATFIYGFHEGRMVFLEPMATREFLASRAEHAQALPSPERYQRPGYYPRAWRIHFDAEREEHVVSLERLERHTPIAAIRENR